MDRQDAFVRLDVRKHVQVPTFLFARSELLAYGTRVDKWVSICFLFLWSRFPQTYSLLALSSKVSLRELQVDHVCIVLPVLRPDRARR